MIRFLTKYKIQFLLIGILLISLWPLSLFIYTPKWDNIDCYLPYRYFVSHYVHNGEWPLWNPFQMFGYPAYSDMQNGMYSPIVWFLLLFGKYNVTSLTVELIIYYIIGITGAYKFSGLYLKTRKARFLVAIAFGLSGFMLGTSQIMIFIAGAAFLPHVLYHFIKFFKENCIIDILYFILFVGLQVTSASPAYSIILVYLLAAIFLYILLKKVISKSNYSFHWWKLILGSVAVIIVLLPYINSLVEFLPYFGRAEKLEYTRFLLQNPFDLMEYISFVYPTATLSNSGIFGNTDLTMRSSYIGIFSLIFVLVSLKYWKLGQVRWLWFGVIVFLILSAGGHTPFYYYFYKLPGFGLFRHPAIFRVHAILFMTILAGIAFEKIDLKKDKKILIYSLSTAILTFVVTLFALVGNVKWIDIKALVKNLNPSVEPLSFSITTQCFVAALIMIPLTILGLWFIIKRENAKKYLVLLVILDLFIYSQMTSSWTIHYPIKQKDYVAHFKQLPNEFDQLSTTKPFKDLVENYEPKVAGLWRNTATYNLSLSYDGHNQTQFKQFNKIEQNGGLEITKENPLFYDVNQRTSPNVGIKPSQNILWQSEEIIEINKDTLLISKTKMIFNGFEAKVINKSSKPDLLVLNQNYHHLWKAFVNEKEVKFIRVNDAFMAIEILENSESKVVFKFDSPKTKLFTLISFCFYLLIIGSIIYFTRKFRTR